MCKFEVPTRKGQEPDVALIFLAGVAVTTNKHAMPSHADPDIAVMPPMTSYVSVSNQGLEIGHFEKNSRQKKLKTQGKTQ